MYVRATYTDERKIDFTELCAPHSVVRECPPRFTMYVLCPSVRSDHGMIQPCSNAAEHGRIRVGPESEQGRENPSLPPPLTPVPTGRIRSDHGRNRVGVHRPSSEFTATCRVRPVAVQHTMCTAATPDTDTAPRADEPCGPPSAASDELAVTTATPAEAAAAEAAFHSHVPACLLLQRRVH